METIGKRLGIFLEKENISVQDFADKVGKNSNTIYRIIKEDRGMNSTTMVEIIKHYPQLNIQWLITGNGNPKLNDVSNNLVKEDDAPNYGAADKELKQKVQAILKNEVVIDALTEILKRWETK